MSEQPEMTPDPLVEKLARFTPHAAGLDRDALLFEAGRASVKPRRLWPAMAGVLALTQSITMMLYFSGSPVVGPPVVVQTVQPQVPEVREPAPSTPDESRAMAYRRAMLTGNLDDLLQTAPETNAVPDEPAWTAHSLPLSLLN